MSTGRNHTQARERLSGSGGRVDLRFGMSKFAQSFTEASEDVAPNHIPVERPEHPRCRSPLLQSPDGVLHAPQPRRGGGQRAGQFANDQARRILPPGDGRLVVEHGSVPHQLRVLLEEDHGAIGGRPPTPAIGVQRTRVAILVPTDRLMAATELKAFLKGAIVEIEVTPYARSGESQAMHHAYLKELFAPESHVVAVNLGERHLGSGR